MNVATDPAYIRGLLQKFRMEENLAVTIANVLDGPMNTFGLREQPKRPHFFQVTLKVQVKHLDDLEHEGQSIVTVKADIGVDYNIG